MICPHPGAELACRGLGCLVLSCVPLNGSSLCCEPYGLRLLNFVWDCLLAPSQRAGFLSQGSRERGMRGKNNMT